MAAVFVVAPRNSGLFTIYLIMVLYIYTNLNPGHFIVDLQK